MDYQAFSTEAKQFLSQYTTKLRLIGTIRLIYFLSGLVGIYFMLAYRWQLILASLFVFIAIFLALVKWYQGIETKRNYWKTRLKLLRMEKERLAHNFDNLDAGEEFYEPSHLYLKDLDIFGKVSLFAYLSRTHTTIGRKRLADWLKAKTSNAQIEARQQISQELAEKTALRLHFQTTAHQSKEQASQIAQLQTWLNDPKENFLPHQWLNIARVVSPIITLLLWLLAWLSLIPYQIAVIFSLANLGLVGVQFKLSKSLHENVGKNIAIFQKYAALWKIIEDISFDTNAAKELQKYLIGSTKAATQFTKLLNLFEYRLNAFAFLFLNGLFLWDIQFGFALEKWRKTHAQHVPLWIDTLADFEALFSLAAFRYNHPTYAVPRISDHFDIKGLAHPLLKEEIRIANDFRIDNLQEIALITGSNMAGKSTFLRAFGVNTVLACAGAVVCANKFEFIPMGICTSMRIIDSLEKGESSFFAELKRLKQILDQLATGSPHVVLLDEILRGTNSKDRYLGSAAVIKQLLKLPAVALVASHDVELSKMANDFPNQIKNYAFEVENTESGLQYPYKIKKGVCQNTNAVFLMQKMGIEV